MEVCLGMIGVSPSEFWDSSPQEIYLTVSGFVEFNSSGNNSEPLARDELEELMELYPD